MNEMEKIARENHHNGNNCSVSLEYLICGVIKAPELDADSAELLKLFGAMDERTRQIMLVQMRTVARF